MVWTSVSELHPGSAPGCHVVSLDISTHTGFNFRYGIIFQCTLDKQSSFDWGRPVRISMMCCRMMFVNYSALLRLTFRQTAFSPDDMKFTLADLVTDPIKSHVDSLRSLALLAIPDTALLAVVIGATGCGWPSSACVMRIEQASFQLWNNTPSSASPALDNTSRIIRQ